jgi:hypothetical protein
MQACFVASHQINNSTQSVLLPINATTASIQENFAKFEKFANFSNPTLHEASIIAHE